MTEINMSVRLRARWVEGVMVNSLPLIAVAVLATERRRPLLSHLSLPLPLTLTAAADPAPVPAPDQIQI
jgi:hypothetical protein